MSDPTEPEPTTARVLDAVQEMLARPWPAGPASANAPGGDPGGLAEWLRWHHLVGARTDGVGALPDWGDAAATLTEHDGRFVGVSLFLWSGLDPVSLIERFRRLAQGFDLLCGEAVERWGSTGAPAACWRDATHTLEMYAHTGAAPGVQLAVADTALADALEAEARARHDVTAHPLAALGSPADAESFAAALDQTDALAEDRPPASAESPENPENPETPDAP